MFRSAQSLDACLAAPVSALSFGICAVAVSTAERLAATCWLHGRRPQHFRRVGVVRVDRGGRSRHATLQCLAEVGGCRLRRAAVVGIRRAEPTDRLDERVRRVRHLLHRVGSGRRRIARPDAGASGFERRHPGGRGTAVPRRPLGGRRGRASTTTTSAAGNENLPTSNDHKGRDDPHAREPIETWAGARAGRK